MTSSSREGSPPAGAPAGGALHLRQAGIEHLPRADHARLFGQSAGRRDPVHDDAELMRRRGFQRLQLAQNGIAAIYREMQLPAALAELFDRLPARPGDDLVDMGDRIGVAPPDNADIALADLARSLELDPQFGSRGIARPGDPGGALVVLLVMAVAHVDMPAEEVFVERVGPLIHRVAGDRRDRAAL